MREQGVQDEIIELLSSMYGKSKAFVKLDKKGKEFPTQKGVKQGDPLSSNLFNAVLEKVFRKMNWEGYGIKINGEYPNNLRFADDIVLIGKDREQLVKMIRELLSKCEKMGLKVNARKTKYMRRRRSDSNKRKGD